MQNGSTFEYQYAISDHQGNTRVLFTSASQTAQTATATFETANQSTEATQFSNYPTASHINVVATNAHTGSNSLYLNGGSSGGQVGVAKSYKVYPGDQLSIQAYAKYLAPTGTASNLSGFAAALLGAFSLPAPAQGEVGTPSSAINTWGGIEAGGFGDGSTDNTDPKVFATILIFDKNYKFLDVAFQQLTATGLMSASYTVKEAGYAFMYVSNEQSFQTDVYIDDVTMSYTPTSILQSNEYYPFGLQTANSWTRDNTTNKFLYDGASELNSTTGMYDLPFRNYDAALGRFFQVDILAHTSSDFTPYHYAANNPIGYNDPTGLEVDAPVDDNAASDEENNYDNWNVDFGKGGPSGGGEGEETFGTSTNEGEGLSECSECDTGTQYDATCPNCPPGSKYDQPRNSKDLYWYNELTGEVLNLNTGSTYSYIDGKWVKTSSGLDNVTVSSSSGSGGNSFNTLDAFSFGLNVADLYRQANGAVTFGMTMRNAEKNAALYSKYYKKMAPSSQQFVSAVKPFKIAGKVMGAVNLAVTGYEIADDLSQGKYYSSGARVAVAGIAAGAAFIPVVGWGITIGIGMADAIWGDDFYNYVEAKLGN